jgi:tRNA(Ile)-lysidine synthase
MLPVKNFIDFIDQNNLFTQKSRVLVALSGGMDSVLMAWLFNAAGFDFGIAHCNFQLRGDEANSDQEFSRRLAEKLNVSFHTINFDTQKHANEQKLSVQMAARELRYQWFEQVRQQAGYDVVALAHHQNDTIETILLNLVRGTGVAGLHGILAKNGNLIRPMLFLTREDIQRNIQENGFEYVEDSSNLSAKYARNKIRLEVVPKLKELNPALEQTFERNLRHFKELEVLLQEKLSSLKKELFVYKDEEIHLPLKDVRGLFPQHLLLYGLLQDFGFNQSTVDDIISSLDKHSGRVFESGEFLLVLDRQNLILTPKTAKAMKPIIINKSDEEAHFGNYRIAILHDDSPLVIKGNPFSVSLDALKVSFPITLRSWEQGDWFKPLGMKTKKKVSDFFVDQKIPLHNKADIPLFINGNGDIMWIGGYRPDERYKVDENTKKVVIFEMYKI